VVLGDLLLDVVARSDAGLRPGSDVAGSLRFRTGGSAANVARAFARLGGDATLVCAVGRDGWGTRLADAVRAEGVTVRAVRVAGTTGRLLALVAGDGERTFVTERGAADALDAADLGVDWFRRAMALHVPMYGLVHPRPTAAAHRAAGLLREGRERTMVSVDLASWGPLRDLGASVATGRVQALAADLLFANRDEAAVLTGRRGRWAPLLELAPVVVVKEGAGGCRVLWRTDGGSDTLEVATTRLVAGDTTGAGDAFAAGFLYALLGADGRVSGPVLRRAALAGHRSAAELLRRPRTELPG
jgi:sugar/nucleoside kinase (ribokinase family)